MKLRTKILSCAAALAIAAIGLTSSGVSAQEPGTKFIYVSGAQLANLEADPANVTLTAYNPDGSQAGTGTHTIPGNGALTLFPLTEVTSGFRGSLVFSSDKNIGAIANILAEDFSAGASYVGSSAGATEVQLPLLNKDNSGFDTWFSVQNASGSASANVNIAYSDGTTAPAATLPANAPKVYYQALETHSEASFAGLVTSDQPVVAAVIQENAGIMFAYTAFTGGDTNPVFPLVNANNANYISGLQIQNAGTASTDVTVSYNPSFVGDACTETRTIAAGGSEIFALFAFNSDNSGTTTTCAAGATFVGSATVTTNSASQPLVGIGNQLLPGVNGEAYGSFSATDATNTVVMPLIMDRNGGYFTGFNIANVGTTATAVNCTFTNSNYTFSDNIAAGGAVTDIQLNKIADSYVGAATCTGDAGAKIVAVVNQLGSAGGADQFLVYEGINK